MSLLGLTEGYRQMIHHAEGALARRRPSQLLTGKESTWVAAADSMNSMWITDSSILLFYN